MKKIFIFSLVLLAHQSMGQNGGIVFLHSSFSEALAKAKAEKKLVFIDCFTDWCVPCKQMSKSIFTQDSIGVFFSRNFISLKIDMEKGEGPALLKQYQVGAFPTFLLLDGNGEIVYKFVGAMDAPAFMQKIREGMDPSNKIAVLLKRYNNGERSHELMRDYIWEALKMKETPRAKELEMEYFSMLTKKQRLARENWFLFGENSYSRELSDMRSTTFNYLLANYKKFVAVQGKKVVDDKISSVFRKMSGYCLRGYYSKQFGYNKADFDVYRKQLRSTKVDDKKDLLIMLDAGQAACEKDTARLVELLANNMGNFQSKNIDITFDFLTAVPRSRSAAFPRWKEVLQVAAANSKNKFLVQHVTSYK